MLGTSELQSITNDIREIHKSQLKMEETIKAKKNSSGIVKGKELLEDQDLLFYQPPEIKVEELRQQPRKIFMSFSSIREESEESSFDIARRMQSVSNSSSFGDGSQLLIDPVIDSSKSQSCDRQSKKKQDC